MFQARTIALSFVLSSLVSCDGKDAGNRGDTAGTMDTSGDTDTDTDTAADDTAATDTGDSGTVDSPDADGDGFSIADGDCDDSDPTRHPGAVETCDEIDNDCDLEVDEEVSSTWYLDFDGDGYGTSAFTMEGCEPWPGYVETSTDCDDTEPTVHPGATDVCNDRDDDCDGSIDEDDTVGAVPWYMDRDADGYGGGAATIACDAPSDLWIADGTDCDDFDDDIHPGADEACDGIDDDCDGLIDDGVTITLYADNDGDGFGDAAETIEACGPLAPYVLDGTDCDDTSEWVNPDATELCNDTDDDCDGVIDEDDASDATTWYQDADGDGYGDPLTTMVSCTLPSAMWGTDSTDCDDTAESIYPGAPETCNELDDDCDGARDEEVTTAFYADSDGDGFGDPEVRVEACDSPSGHVSDGTDCDDAAAEIHPDAAEACNGDDDDCDGEIDEDLSCLSPALVPGDTSIVVSVEGDLDTGTLEFRCSAWEGDTCTHPEVRVPTEECPAHSEAGEWLTASFYNSPSERICPTFCKATAGGEDDGWSECSAGSATTPSMAATGYAVSSDPGVCSSSDFRWWLDTSTHEGASYLYTLRLSSYGSGQPRLRVRCDGW